MLVDCQPQKLKTAKINTFVFQSKMQKFCDAKIYQYRVSPLRATVKILKIGTPGLTTVVVLNIKHYDFSMQ